MRRAFFAGIADFWRFGQLLQAAFEQGHLFAVASQFRVQADQRLVHLFQIVLQMSHGGFQLDQSFVVADEHGEKSRLKTGR